MRPEDELCFSCRAEDLPRLESALWVAELESAGDAGCSRARALGAKRAAHLFLRGTEGPRKERVRVWREGAEAVASLQWKCFFDGRKHESPSRMLRGRAEIASRLRSRGPIVAGFAKERLFAIHRFAGARRPRDLKIGVDRVAPFSLSGAAGTDVDIVHVEFEGDGSGIEREFVASPYFAAQIGPWLRPLTAADTKWRVAQALVGPVDVSGCDAAWVETYLCAAEAALGARLGVARMRWPPPAMAHPV